MIRVIKTAEDQILLDATGRKKRPGRLPVSIHGMSEKGRKSRGLERSFKMAIPKEVYESLKKEMEQIDEQK